MICYICGSNTLCHKDCGLQRKSKFEASAQARHVIYEMTPECDRDECDYQRDKSSLIKLTVDVYTN